MPESSVLSSLRETLRAVPDDGHSRRRVMPFGVPDIDSQLADGGLRLDALHEVAAATPSLRDEAAATLFVAGVAARAWGPILWVVRRRDLFAPALAQSGLMAKRVIHAEADDDAGVLALMEEGLHHPALGAVIGEVRRAAPAATKRVQQAAARGRTVALLLKRPAREGGDPFAAASPAATRWRIGTVPMVGTARPRWEVTLARQSDGAPFTATAMACDDTGRIAPVVTRREHRRAVSEILRVTPSTEEQAEAA